MPGGHGGGKCWRWIDPAPKKAKEDGVEKSDTDGLVEIVEPPLRVAIRQVVHQLIYDELREKSRGKEPMKAFGKGRV